MWPIVAQTDLYLKWATLKIGQRVKDFICTFAHLKSAHLKLISTFEICPISH